MDIFYGLIEVLFSKVWELFSIPWPGFSFSIITPFLAVAFAVVALKIVSLITGVSLGGSVASVAQSARARSNKHSARSSSNSKKGG